MSPIELAVDIVGLFLAGLIGRQGIVMTFKQRQMSIDSGLNWPWEWANSLTFSLWALGLAFLLFLIVLVFGFEITMIGYGTGIVVGYLARNVWKIDRSPPNVLEEDRYAGD